MRTVYESEILIQRPLAEVYAYVADLENAPRWNAPMLEMRATDALPPATVGKRYRERLRVPLKGDAWADVEVVESNPQQRVAIHVSLQPLRPRIDYEFAAEGDATRFRWTLRTRSESPLLRGLATRVMRVLLSREVPRAQRSLKQLLEAA